MPVEIRPGDSRADNSGDIFLIFLTQQEKRLRA